MQNCIFWKDETIFSPVIHKIMYRSIASMQDKAGICHRLLIPITPLNQLEVQFIWSPVKHIWSSWRGVLHLPLQEKKIPCANTSHFPTKRQYFNIFLAFWDMVFMSFLFRLLPPSFCSLADKISCPFRLKLAVYDPCFNELGIFWVITQEKRATWFLLTTNDTLTVFPYPLKSLTQPH